MTTNWTSRRWASLWAHIFFAAIPLIASTAASFNWWVEQFGIENWGYAVIAVGIAEILALSSLILYIARIEWPLEGLRHALPFISILPLGWGLYELLSPKMGGYAVLLSIICAGWFVYLSFKLLHSLEGLFIDPVAAMRERTAGEMRQLQTTLAGFQVASRAVHTFALSVLDQPAETITTSSMGIAPAQLPMNQPTMPILQSSDAAHPRMLEIAMLASKKHPTGEWMYSIPEIQQEVPVAAGVVEVVARLVRGGHMVVAGGSDGAS